jgi:hypothetical protein
MEDACIICGRKVPGLKVKNDYILSSIRWFKHNVTRNEKGFRLVVCKDDFAKYYKQRKSFERRRSTYVGLGVVFAAALFILSDFNYASLFYGLGIVVFLYLLSLVNYMPALEATSKDEARKPGKAGHGAGRKAE